MSRPTITANVPYTGLSVVIPTSQVPSSLRLSTPTAPSRAPRTARRRSVIDGSQRNRHRKTVTSSASAMPRASSVVSTVAAVLPDRPIPSRNVPDTEVMTLVTAMDANTISPSPTRTPRSRSRRTSALPTSTLWCQMIRMASRSALIQASPASSRAARPIRPTPTFELPILAMSSLSAIPGR